MSIQGRLMWSFYRLGVRAWQCELWRVTRVCWWISDHLDELRPCKERMWGCR